MTQGERDAFKDNLAASKEEVALLEDEADDEYDHEFDHEFEAVLTCAECGEPHDYCECDEFEPGDVLDECTECGEPEDDPAHGP